MPDGWFDEMGAWREPVLSAHVWQVDGGGWCFTVWADGEIAVVGGPFDDFGVCLAAVDVVANG